MKTNETTRILHFDEVILNALREDIPWEDVSANAVVPEGVRGRAELIAKANGVLAGLNVFARTFALLDPQAEIVFRKREGEEVRKGELIAEVTGDMRAILSGERTALNFLQRMSGIATYTRRAVKLLEGSKTRLVDTRKTTPLLRSFEKYAVQVGGAGNHRFNLSDGVLLKEALEEGADIVMLDNMSPETLKEALALAKGRAETEISGNVTEENIGVYASLGADYISSGALTHSAPILDLSLKNLKPIG